MPSHDDQLLEGHDEGRDGVGCCPNCQELLGECCCCPICSGDGRLMLVGKYQICIACDGWGLRRAVPEAAT